MFAIVKTGGKQYIVEPGTRILVEKLTTAKGERVVLGDVLLFEEGGNLHIGNPTVAGVSIEGRVIREVRTPKVIIFKYKPKKRYRKKRGYRHTFTEVEILSIKKGSPETPRKRKALAVAKASAFVKTSADRLADRQR